MSEVISIRVDGDTKKKIIELGYNPSDFLKEILKKELKKERSERALRWIRDNRLPAGKRSTEKMIREDRDFR